MGQMVLLPAKRRADQVRSGEDRQARRRSDQSRSTHRWSRRRRGRRDGDTRFERSEPFADFSTVTRSSGAHEAHAGRGDSRQVKGTIAKVVLSYVRRTLGEEAVAEVLADAARTCPSDHLSGWAPWTSPAYTIAVAEAAGRVCGDPDIGRRSGEEMMRLSTERGTIDFVRAAGSVANALKLAANAGTRLSNGRVIEVNDVGDGHATIVANYLGPNDAHPFYCGVAAGYYGLVPEVFGFAGVIAEPECMCRGDQRCFYRLSWSTTGHAVAVDDAAVATSRERTNTFVERFERLHAMATEMAAAEDVDTLLARITDSAGAAIDAPRYLLAVRTDESAPVRIHFKGFTPARANSFATRLLSGDLRESAECLIGDVASARNVYGRLIALYPKGSTVTSMDRRLFDGYARHAAAALEAVASLERARRDRDTAQELLALAKALAEVSSTSDVAGRVATAVRRVAVCEDASVWIWDPTVEGLRLEGVATDDDDQRVVCA